MSTNLRLILCAMAVGVLAIGFATEGGNPVGDATAAVQATDVDDSGYFPGRFPTPQGMPGPHIEAF